MATRCKLYSCWPGARALGMIVCLLTLSPAAVFAVRVDGLFEVEMPVPDESRQIRQTALADGLVEILIRVSGDRQILQKISPPSPNPYLKQFRYIPVEQSEEEAADEQGDEQPGYMLWAQYNPTRIMNLLRKEGISVWGEHRSQSVIWFAVRDGKNQYLLREKDTSVLKQTAAEAFRRRGIPVLWPRYDAEDKRELSFTDVWAGFTEPLLKASERYASGPVVSANLSWNGSLWVGDWTVFVGKDSQRWTLKDRDYTVVISQGIDLVADVLGDKYAVLESVDAEDHEQVVIKIEQVSSVKQYRHIEKFLRRLRVVQALHLTQVEPESVEFKVTLRSRVEDFLEILKTNNKLERIIVPEVKPQIVPLRPAQPVPTNPPGAEPVTGSQSDQVSKAGAETGTEQPGLVAGVDPAAITPTGTEPPSPPARTVYRYKLIN